MGAASASAQGVDDLYRKTQLDLGDSWIMTGELPNELKMDSALFEELWEMHPAEQEVGMIFGKQVKYPRYQQNYGVNYKFSGKEYKALPITHPYLKKLMDFVKIHSGLEYNQLLINWYSDGNHYIGEHSDNEPEILKNSAIYSFSFGQERDFVVKSRDATFRKVYKARDNTLIIMGGEMQKYYKHSVPRRALSKAPKHRINITIRLLTFSY